MLETTEGAIKNGQCRDTGNMEHTIQDQDRMIMLETTEGAIKNGQHRDTGNMEHKIQDKDRRINVRNN